MEKRFAHALETMQRNNLIMFEVIEGSIEGGLPSWRCHV
jgi:hypothetical protein